MAAVTPNSTIHLYKVPWDSEYKNVPYFNGNLNAQENYMLAQSANGKVLDAQSYQRVNDGQFRCGIVADELYIYNYMSFKNTAFGDKTFYAFITGIDYVNTNMSIVNYQLDIFQSYIADFEIADSYVVREHAAQDVLFGNLQPENVDTGPIIFDDYKELSFDIGKLSDYSVIIAIIDNNAASYNGNLYNGIYSAAELFSFDDAQVSAIRDKLDEYKKYPDSILTVYMAPKIFADKGVQNISPTAVARIPQITINDTIDGYKPKNFKLYTSPYNFLHIDNSDGQEISLQYELFDAQDGECRIEAYASVVPPVRVVLHPYRYSGSGNHINMTQSLAITGYPICIVATDAWAAWSAQSTVDFVAGLANTGLQLTMGNTVGAFASLTGSLFSMGAGAYKAWHTPDVTKGSFGGGAPNISAHNLTYFYSRAHITRDYAERIDHFFTKYGYATNDVKTPNLHSRSRFNYVQTDGANIIPKAGHGLPDSAIRTIAATFDRGVTFWHDMTLFGNFLALDNNPA